MKLLYIEDSPLDVELTRRELLLAIPDLSLTVAGTVTSGMAELQARADYDLVLTDLRLPDGSGLDIVNYVREHSLHCAVIVLTGQGDEEIAVAAIKAGADDYVAKRSGYALRLPHLIQAALGRFRAEIARKSGLLRVLYAEHNEADIELTRRHLVQRAPHIQLETVYSAAEVLGRLSLAGGEDPRCDVLLLDFSLPDDNALDLLRVLRHERRLDLPVVLVTGQGDEEVAAQVLRLGAADYIVKHAGYLFELPIALENAFAQASLARERAALRASEARFRRLAENAADLIYSVSFVPERRFEYVSPAAIALTGYTPEEHYADPDLGFKIIHPGDRHLLENAGSGALEFSRPLVLRWVRKDGAVLWTEQRNTPVFNEEGQLVGIEGIARDITDSMNDKLALEQQLTELEAIYGVSNALRTAQTEDAAVTILVDQALAALKTSAAAVWLYDPARGRLHVAAASGWCAALRHTQLAPGESIAGEVFATAAPRVEATIVDIPNLGEPLRSCAPQGWGGAWLPIHTSSEIVGILFVAVEGPRTIAGEQVKLLHSLSEMAGSIIQRLRLLHEAQVQAELMQQIVNTMPDGLALLDSRGHVLLANPAANQLLSRLGAAGGERIVALGERQLDEILAGGSVWQEIEHNGGIYLINCSPIDPEGPSTLWVLVLADVTDQRQQQRYQETQDRLATVGQLAAGIAHDFNNVLGVITVYSEILLSVPNLTEKQHNYLTTVIDQAQHAARLVRQVLDFSRQSVMERSQVDLYPLLNEQIKLLRHTLPENIDLQLYAERKHLVVHADPTRLRQVVMNLAINARDAMPEGGRLAFTLARSDVAPGDAPLPGVEPGAWLRLEVEDTGSGIAPEHLPHIFEPFFTTKAPGAGTGLGLAQVYGIVMQHGGAIDAESTPGKGTRFTMYLPLVEAGAETHSSGSTAPVTGGGESLMVVEDNVELREAIADSLTRLGYHVITAPDAETAVTLATEIRRPLDLVLTDLVLPGANGVEMYASLQRRHPHVRLIVMTGHPLTEARMAILRNIDNWIQKPFTLASLAARVRSLLDKQWPVQ
jgi:PAS domain S-box-containing protein